MKMTKESQNLISMMCVHLIQRLMQDGHYSLAYCEVIK